MVNHHGYDIDKGMRAPPGLQAFGSVARMRSSLTCRCVGHYTNFSKDPNTGNWRLYDDVRVHAASEEDVLASQAFLLVYTNAKTCFN